MPRNALLLKWFSDQLLHNQRVSDQPPQQILTRKSFWFIRTLLSTNFIDTNWSIFLDLRLENGYNSFKTGRLLSLTAFLLGAMNISFCTILYQVLFCFVTCKKSNRSFLLYCINLEPQPQLFATIISRFKLGMHLSDKHVIWKPPNIAFNLMNLPRYNSLQTLTIYF